MSSSAISDKALAQFDYINIMSYGGIARMTSEAAYWINTRHIPKLKMNLGVQYSTAETANPTNYTNYANYAVANSGGIMIWVLNNDRAKPISFLSQMDSVIHNRPAVFSPQPVSQTVKMGKSVTFTATINLAGATYNWQLSKDKGKTFQNCGSYTSGSGVYFTSGNVLTLSPVAQTWQAYKWRLAATYFSGSVSRTVYSNTVGVTITK